ncbi:MAG: SDR family NAD(P)-dependent oxidoreductase [Chloroflexota bacterium]|jgi:3-oxoacyl-[acyl-carrier protein] reductase
MKTAMIWGANGGIGRALLETLRIGGWNTVAFSRHEEAVQSMATHSIYSDIADSFSVQKAVQAAAYEVTDVNLWIYSAGDIIAAPVEEMNPETWRRIMDANLNGAYLAAHHSMPLLASDAHLFFIGAINERLRLPGLSAYAAAKAGLEAFGEALRKEQRKRSVTVVRPVAVDTPLWSKVPMRMPKDAPPASKLADKILSAYEEGHSGLLDLA